MITIIVTENNFPFTEPGSVFHMCLKDDRINHSVETVQASAPWGMVYRCTPSPKAKGPA